MKYHNITKDDMLNGDGLRVVFWVSGCEHACTGCHNVCTWDENSGLDYDEAVKAELFKQLEKDYISGITFTGGDPLFQANCQPICALAKEIKEKFPHKTQWLYTGDMWEDIQNWQGLLYIDVLVDGPFVLAEKNATLHWRGSANQRVIDVKKSLRTAEIVLHNS
ncbi:MAG: anaerobic ribonucleoside-triphosphate reductase activating protein [Lachnospiraceae bacterium]|nr:anaerobic ribonucleoside-triphosphate reductase activating protein [Lachnospiraceae bacterium]